MNDQFGFIVKVFLLSAGISLLIKYIAPSFPIPATATNALIIVMLPTVILAIAFFWRFQGQKEN